MAVSPGDLFRNMFPKSICSTAIQSFFLTGATRLVCGAGGTAAVLTGSIAATATVIEAATRPFVQVSLGQYDLARWAFRHTAPLAIAMSLTEITAPLFDVSYNRMAAPLIYGAASAIFNAMGSSSDESEARITVF